MDNIIALAFASLIASAAFAPATAQESDGKFMFRYNAAGGSAATKPDDEEGNEGLAITHYAPMFAPLDYRGNAINGQNFIELFGNGKYSGRANFVFATSGFKSAPSFSVSVPTPENSLSPLMMEDGSLFELKGPAYYVITTINLPYNFSGGSVRVTASADGKNVSRDFPISTRRYGHDALSFDSSNFSSLLDTTSQPTGTNTSDYLSVVGGVPPYRATINLTGTNFPNNSGNNGTDFSNSTIEEIMDNEVDRAFDTYTRSGDTSRIIAQISPNLSWFDCANELETSTVTSDTSYSITITDSRGTTVTSPTQTIRYYSERPSCTLTWELR